MAIDYDGGLTCSCGVTDLERSIAWYQDVLGFELLYRAEQIAWCELKTSVARVNIGLSEVEEAGGRGGATWCGASTSSSAASCSRSWGRRPWPRRRRSTTG